MSEQASKTQIQDFIDKARMLFDNAELVELLEKYHDGTTYPKTNHVHNIVTGSAVKLVKDVIENGGTEDEVNQALRYMIACINSKGHMLNVKKYAKENGIWDLRKKYQPWRRYKAEEGDINGCQD